MKTFVLMLALLPFAVNAFGDKEAAACAADKNTVTRLSCFDKLAAHPSQAPSATEALEKPVSGAWINRVRADRKTGRPAHTAVLLSGPSKNAPGKSMALIAQCANNKTDLWIDWEPYIGNSGAEVTYQIDKEKAKATVWTLSTKASLSPSSPVDLLKSIAQSTSFVVNVTPDKASPVTAVFDTTGADVALADIRKDCGW